MPAASKRCSGACRAKRPRSASGVKLGRVLIKSPSRVRLYDAKEALWELTGAESSWLSPGRDGKPAGAFGQPDIGPTSPNDWVWPNCDIGCIEVTQRSSLLPYRVMLSFASEAREGPGIAPALVHYATRRRGGGVADCGAGAVRDAGYWIS